VLNIEKLASGYGRADVIHGIDIEVPKGHLVCIIGGNGAGKSTAMRTISGMMNATSGRVRLAGRDITNMPSHRIALLGLAHVPEGRKVFVSMSVHDNLRLGAYGRADRSVVIRDIDEVMELFPRLRERRGQLAGTLSGGEQQMLAIGRALMAAPEVLLLDEPSLGLAPKLVQEVYAIIGRLRRQGRTMLLVEQFANIALGVADVGYVLENGRIVLSGTGADLLNSPRVRDAYVGVQKINLND
jgi:branched-chain amino acid transport system ATP-binding protein